MNNTWTITTLPSGKISCKWLFKLKLNSDGIVAKYKAHLVACSFTQQYGLNFQKTLSLVAKIITSQVLLSLAVLKNGTWLNWTLIMFFSMVTSNETFICNFPKVITIIFLLLQKHLWYASSTNQFMF